ncbi:hypothetical protein CEP52_001612 [Fusarium oligoseptatum]|uniref:Uncharacterized protein n=2 Tax=Fusarium solani species complex TaxID=232080 RepID=A0A428UIF9_9HYPO|nr:hypothetical protein CDV31_016928 [Fusarium ambrosium]RSM14022.1 hypothetical protein CEP52_001612 [Fusarium oligoseptatum]
MSFEPQYHDTGGSSRRMSSCPPETTSQPFGGVKGQNIADGDTASTASCPSHYVQLDLETGSNNHEHEPQGQEWHDYWTVENILQVQQDRHQEILQEIRAANAEDRVALNEAMEQNMSMNLGQGLQHIMEFFTNWTKEFTQHHLVNKVATLEEQLDLAIQQKDQLSQEYKEMRARHNKACTKLDKALRERDDQRRLADGGALANSTKVTDDAVMDKWSILSYNIRTLAHSLAKSPPPQRLDQIVVARLNGISQSPRKDMQDQDYRDFLLQGYLWSMVNDKVFDAGTRIWGGPGMADLKTIQDNLINRLEAEDAGEHGEICQQAARWLAQGSGILNQLWGCEPGGMRALANIETRLLVPFFSAKNPSSGSAGKVSDQLSAIIECAVELDQMFMCSKAIFRIHWKDISQDHSKHQRYNSNTMESIAHEGELSSQSNVKMVVSPFLWKAGNADGQNYESSMLLIKAAVVCN